MRIRKRVGVTILLLAVTAATVVVLSPGDTADSNALAVGSTVLSPAGTAAMRAYLDPETGELTTGVEPAEAVIELNPALEYALSQDSEGLVVEKHADGSVSVDLQGRFQSAAIAGVGKDGKVAICTDNVADAQKSLSGRVPTPARRR